MDNLNWLGRLVSTLETSFPDIWSSDNSAAVEPSDAAASEASENEFAVDLNSLEISQVLKRKKKKPSVESSQSGAELVSWLLNELKY